MVVRVRVRLRRGDIVVETSALANSGYEAETPQVLVPRRLAAELGLWPPPPNSETVFDTAGGPLTVWVVPRAATIKVVEPDAKSGEVEVDVVISRLADEVLLCDKLIGAFRDNARGRGAGVVEVPPRTSY